MVIPAQAQESRRRNVILLAVGTEVSLEVVVIQDILTGPLTPASKGDRLIELAKQAGGQDNITVVLCGVAD